MTDIFSRERAAGVSIDALSSRKILLGGAGNTGSHFIERATRNFIGNFFVIDFDKEGYQSHNFAHSSILLDSEKDKGKPKAETLIERASKKLLIDGKWSGKTMDIRDIGPEIVKHFDYALGFFDNKEARRYLYEVSRIAGVPFIETGLSNFGHVQLQAFNHKKGEPCYCCTAPRNTIAQSCGLNYENDIARGIAPATDVSGAIAAVLAIQAIMNIEKGCDFSWNTLIYYDPFMFSIEKYKHSPNPLCDICSNDVTPKTVIPLEGSVDTVTYSELAEKVNRSTNKVLKICLPGRFVEEDYCSACGTKKILNRPERRIGKSDVICPDCIKKNSNEFLSLHVNNRKVYDGFDELPSHIRSKTLFEVGFAYGGHIFTMDESNNIYYFTMKDDTKIISDFI